MNSTFLSIIIPTYNGAQKVVHALRALETQSYVNFEVIVVIDGSTDGTAKVLQQQTFELDLIVIEQPNGGRSVSRNIGAKTAKGDLLIFFDDDIRPISQCVEIHVAHHDIKPQSILVGSPLEDKYLSKTDLQKYKAFLSRKWMHIVSREEQPIVSPFITAANCSMSKELFFELSGFDERLNDAEDFDLAVRAFKNAVPIYVSTKAIGWHDDFISCVSYVKRQREYRRSHEMLKQVKPDLYATTIERQSSKIGWIKKSVYQFFSHKIWVLIVDRFNILLVLPRKLRYLIYDLIITGLSVHFPHRKI
jgi:glycosyltransferase involved in cell wall biosynthesis